MDQRYPPRKLGLEALVETLVREHVVIRETMALAKQAADKGDFAAAGTALRGLEPLFRQHIADEEAQVLGLLIRQLGVQGAEYEIGVFRQHRPIYGLMRKLQGLAGMQPKEMEENRSELESLFEEHARSEESRVFPRALSLSGSRGRGEGPSS